MSEASQVVTAAFALVAFVVGLFFRSYRMAALAGVVLGVVIAGVLTWGLAHANAAPDNLAGASGYIFGRVIATCVLAALVGCLIRRGTAALFRRSDKSTSA